ncbi:hypothetical protein SCP_0607660 [Sparassis crispa]|uniref:Uncharacterized protein n=1 Tax=Sparassis crispa TaxID=139825 RepID=A0A401GRE3_9APHY|nr:hypothetical protein SCP_0607660 [Sparassis crispa]GBE84786.1 hypothetical protein SCP_0607660 [Sparassis crispa]
MTTLSARNCAPRPSAISESFPPPQTRAFVFDLTMFPSSPPPRRPAIPGGYDAREHPPPIQPQCKPIYPRRRNAAHRARIRQHERIMISEPYQRAEDPAVEWPSQLGPAEPVASRPARTPQARRQGARLL